MDGQNRRQFSKSPVRSGVDMALQSPSRVRQERGSGIGPDVANEISDGCDPDARIAVYGVVERYGKRGGQGGEGRRAEWDVETDGGCDFVGWFGGESHAVWMVD